MRIYLDNAATTRPDERVVEAMLPFLRDAYGNASSIHRAGVAAAKAVERARATLAEAIGAEADEVLFTSGGTESNNLALKGAALARRRELGGRHVVTSRIEHSSVLDAVRWLEQLGFEVTLLPVDAEGRVSCSDLERALRSDTLLVSLHHANNEVGTIQRIGEAGHLCRERGVVLHTDASQSFTKLPLDVVEMQVDLATLSAHKCHGPVGVGALYVRRGLLLEPLLHGGGQEGAMRSGTLNTPGIAGFGKAVELAEMSAAARMAELRDRFIAYAQSRIDGLRLNGARGEERLCNNVNVSVAGMPGKRIFAWLNEKGIAVSTGSACSSAALTPSHVLLAMEVPADVATGAVRLSLSKWTSWDELEAAVDGIAAAVAVERAA